MKCLSTSWVRLFQGKDAARCCAIINACLQDMAGLNQAAKRYVTGKNIPSFLSEEFNRFYSLVYVKDDEVLGLGCLDGNEIKRMYTHPTSQGQGVGRVILRSLENEARRRGIVKILIMSSPSAEGFYRKCGYVHIGPGNFAIDSAKFQFVKMVKRLATQ